MLVHNTRKTTRKGGKLASCWTGPFVVQSVLQKGTYKLEGLQCAVNGNRLKLYVTKNKDEDAPEQDKCGSDSESDIQYPQDTGASRKRFRKDKGRCLNNEQASGESATQNQDEDAPEQDKCGSDSESDIQYPQDTGASRKRFRKDKDRCSNNEQASGESATQNQDEDAPEQDKCGSDSESDIQYPQDTGASRKRFNPLVPRVSYMIHLLTWL